MAWVADGTASNVGGGFTRSADRIVAGKLTRSATFHMGSYKAAGAPVFVTMVTTGDCDIVAFGAQGGNGGKGGYGAEIGGTVHLTAGENALAF